MAESTKKPEEKPTPDKTDGNQAQGDQGADSRSQEANQTTSGQWSSQAGGGADTHVPGVDEGTVKALRQDAGMNQLPGHEADLLAWENSPEGVAFREKTAKENVAKAKAEAKAYDAQFEDDGKSKAETAYVEAVGTK